VTKGERDAWLDKSEAWWARLDDMRNEMTTLITHAADLLKVCPVDVGDEATWLARCCTEAEEFLASADRCTDRIDYIVERAEVSDGS